MIMYLLNSIILHVYEVFGNTYFRLVSKCVSFSSFSVIVFAKAFLYSLAVLKIQALTPRPTFWLRSQQVRKKNISMKRKALAF